jgi:propanediol dehydratase small subunit
MASPGPNPERDRDLARQNRLGPRRAADAAEVVQAIVGGPEGARIRRFLRVGDALATVLPDAVRAKIRPVRLDKGILTIEVADAVLMSELRNHRQTELIQALVAAGTGANRLAWRLMRR